MVGTIPKTANTAKQATPADKQQKNIANKI
jgi:hypothetical protein